MTKEKIFTRWRNEVSDLGDAYNLLDYLVDEYEEQIKVKNEEIERLKRYMGVHDPIALVKLVFSDMVVKPLVQDIATKKALEECASNIPLFDAKFARMVHIIEYAVENGQIHNMAKALVEKEDELQKLRREHDIAIIRGYTFE